METIAMATFVLRATDLQDPTDRNEVNNKAY